MTAYTYLPPALERDDEGETFRLSHREVRGVRIAVSQIPPNRTIGKAVWGAFKTTMSNFGFFWVLRQSEVGPLGGRIIFAGEFWRQHRLH